MEPLAYLAELKEKWQLSASEVKQSPISPKYSLNNPSVSPIIPHVSQSFLYKEKKNNKIKEHKNIFSDIENKCSELRGRLGETEGLAENSYINSPEPYHRDYKGKYVSFYINHEYKNCFVFGEKHQGVVINSKYVGLHPYGRIPEYELQIQVTDGDIYSVYLVSNFVKPICNNSESSRKNY